MAVNEQRGLANVGRNTRKCTITPSKGGVISLSRRIFSGRRLLWERLVLGEVCSRRLSLGGRWPGRVRPRKKAKKEGQEKRMEREKQRSRHEKCDPQVTEAASRDARTAIYSFCSTCASVRSPMRRKPPMGFEPTTCALRKRCSTAELGWQGAESIHEIWVEVEEFEFWSRVWRPKRVLGERFRPSES